MIALYVYFRARATDDAAVAAALAELRALSRTHCGIEPRLMRRPQPRDGMRTWMEVYEAIDSDGAGRLERELPRLVRHSGLETLIDGERHLEHFESLASPGACA